MPVTTSVIIPVKNGERFIGEALSSVLPQIEADDEILVVDDASTDRTRSRVEDIDDPRIKIIEGEGRGVSAARNIGLAKAAGEFVAFLDHDDLWPEDRHRILLSGLRDGPQYDASYGRTHVILEPDAPPQPIDHLEGKHRFSHVSSGLYRKTLLASVGLFDETLHVCEDFDFSLRLSEYGMRPLLCDVAGLYYRRHGTNSTVDQAVVRQGIVDVIARRLSRAKARKKG